METVGFVRKVDEQGRVVFPIDMRNELDIKDNQELKIAIQDDTIFFTKENFEIANDKMQDSTITRKTDELGRIVIPKEYRKLLNIEFKDPVEINRCGKMITIKKSMPFCIFCNDSETLNEYKDRNVCDNCIEQLTEIKKVMVKTSLINNKIAN